MISNKRNTQGKIKRPRQPRRQNKAYNSSKPSYDSLHDQSQRSVFIKEVGGFPNEFKWRYTYTIPGATIPANGTAISSGNNYSLNAPGNRTGTGWPTLSNVYDEYVITAVSVRIDFMNKSATVPYRLNMCPYDDDVNTSFPATSDNLFVQNPLAVSKSIAVTGGSPSVVTLSRRYTMQEVAGYDKPVDMYADTLTGYVGGTFSTHSFSAPNSIYSLYVSCTTGDGSAHLSNIVYFNLYFTYEVTFYSRLAGAAY